MTFICFRISDSVLFSKEAGKSEGVCVSFVCVNGGGWTGEVAVKWKGSTGDSGDSGKNWYGSLTVEPLEVGDIYSFTCYSLPFCSSSNNKTLNARLLAETQVCHRSYIIAAILFLNPRRGLLKFQIYYCYFAFKYNLRHQNHLEGQRNYHLSPWNILASC